MNRSVATFFTRRWSGAEICKLQSQQPARARHLRRGFARIWKSSSIPATSAGCSGWARFASCSFNAAWNPSCESRRCIASLTTRYLSASNLSGNGNFRESNMGKVYLVGAGPGDPELLTLRAARLLQEADIILHDALVSPEILARVGAAKVIDIGKRCGTKLLTQEEINLLLVSYAAEYSIVVRLKSGDPSIFG